MNRTTQKALARSFIAVALVLTGVLLMEVFRPELCLSGYGYDYNSNNDLFTFFIGDC